MQRRNIFPLWSTRLLLFLAVASELLPVMFEDTCDPRGDGASETGSEDTFVEEGDKASRRRDGEDASAEEGGEGALAEEGEGASRRCC